MTSTKYTLEFAGRDRTNMPKTAPARTAWWRIVRVADGVALATVLGKSRAAGYVTRAKEFGWEQ